MSTTIIVLTSVVAVFSFYGIILTKFYRRKRKMERFHVANSDVQMKQIISSSGNGEIFHLDTFNKRMQKKISVSSQLSFHMSYLKSSNYVLVTLLAFFMCHAPLFVHQMIEITKWVICQKYILHLYFGLLPGSI